jgi:hypothetical protein
VAYISPDPDPDPETETGDRHRPSRLGVVIVGMVATLVLMGSIGYAMFGASSDSTVRSTPQASRPAVVTPPERLTPVVYPTSGVYVPPIPTAGPTTGKPSTKTASPKPKPKPKPTTAQRPPCPVQAPFFHDWCVRNGYQPPRGG